MDTRKNISTLFALALVIGLLLAGCNSRSNGETPRTEQRDTPTAVVLDLPQTEQSTQPDERETETPEAAPEASGMTYTIVDTGQTYCYDDTVSIPCPEAGSAYFGQDAQYAGNPPSYADNGDGTITDLNTNLMWAKDPGSKLTYDQAVAGAAGFNLAGYNDWRLPTIKELYSLIDFSGYDPSGCESEAACPDLVPFIDTETFNFQYGQPEAGERLIDAQFISSTAYAGQGVEGGLVFGVNFADGRIKGYGTGPMPGATQDKPFFVLYVRGETGYGTNQLLDNGDGTISDQASGLTWMQTDSQQALGWGDALAYCENLSWAGYDDWRLPNAKELYSILDTTRSPDTSNTAATNSLFQSTPVTNEAGGADYAYYWTSTTHLNRQVAATEAVYIAFGRAMGYIGGTWTDIHGAGAQRSDPKMGDPGSFPQGRGPQGDAVRILNYARCVRGGVSDQVLTGGEVDPNALTVSSVPATPVFQITPSLAGDQPPPEAFAACEGKTANTACQYEWVFGRQNGVCYDLFGQLVCMPGVVLPTFPSP